jgi:multidrug transporter EmrE-like cation transporter
MTSWWILVAGIAANAAASLLVKKAVTAGPLPLDAPWQLLGNAPLVGGLACYGMAFGLYAWALSRMPLGVVHPVMTAGAIAVVALVSALWLRESVSLAWALGIALIVAGVVLVTAGQPR